MEGGLTEGGESTLQYADDVSQKCTLETCIILLANITPIRLTEKCYVFYPERRVLGLHRSVRTLHRCCARVPAARARCPLQRVPEGAQFGPIILPSLSTCTHTFSTSPQSGREQVAGSTHLKARWLCLARASSATCRW